MIRERKKGQTVNTPMGKRALDSAGSAVAAARMDPMKAYCATPLLLQEYINTGSESAWNEIRERIDNIYITVGSALETLEREEGFAKEIQSLIKNGKKLFFKPNLVLLPAIDFQTHGPVLIGTCLPWEFQAAAMRWFHDKLGISYHQMATGEAGTATTNAAVAGTRACGGKKVTTLALMEGKFGADCGGWGFYFARKYLNDSHAAGHTDDPMSGYQESLDGVCLPPGEAPDKLLVYDLNKIADDYSNGRDVPVADGINFKTITLHKAIVGGDPNNAQDRRAWPGCVLINLCKLKIHITELFTCSVKNLGIGLYPMEVNTSLERGKYRWKYAVPPLRVAMFKMRVPHRRWIPQADEDSGLPVRDSQGNYIWTRTGGLEAGMADAIQAVRGQGVRMLHVADAIEAVNIHHSGPGCTPVQEGLVLAASDMVALDNCASRYLFSMVPAQESAEAAEKNNLKSDVIQRVPMPEIKGKDIISGQGYDSALTRYGLLRHCEDRGLGRQEFYAVGDDLWEGGKLASLNQHLGRVEAGAFQEFLTETMYHTPNKPLWDLQASCLAYLELDDKLTGATNKRRILDAYDENGDGVIDYMETGHGDHPGTTAYGASLSNQNLDPLAALKLRFLLASQPLRLMNKNWNAGRHDIGESGLLAQTVATAFGMSNAREERPDPAWPGRNWGKGKWPSFETAMRQLLLTRIYGQGFPNRFDLTTAPYGLAFSYADSKFNKSQYTNPGSLAAKEDLVGKYHKAAAGGAELLPFTFYVPPGMGKSAAGAIPNTKETDDPGQILTAVFKDGEIWRDLKISSFGLE